MESAIIHFAIGWVKKLWDNIQRRSTASDNATPQSRAGRRAPPTFTLLKCNNVHQESRKLWIAWFFMRIITFEINNVSYYWMIPKYYLLLDLLCELSHWKNTMFRITEWYQNITYCDVTHWYNIRITSDVAIWYILWFICEFTTSKITCK